LLVLACCFCTNLVRLQKFALRFAGLHLVSRCWVKQPNSIVFFPVWKAGTGSSQVVFASTFVYDQCG